MQNSNDELYPVESFDEFRSCELVKRVRKLRWIGNEEDAEELERELRGGRAVDCVLAEVFETD